MKCFEKLLMLIAAFFLPAMALAEGPGQMGNGMMDSHMMPGMGGMGIFMVIICILLIILLVLAILALIKYLRKK